MIEGPPWNFVRSTRARARDGQNSGVAPLRARAVHAAQRRCSCARRGDLRAWPGRLQTARGRDAIRRMHSAQICDVPRFATTIMVVERGFDLFRAARSLIEFAMGLYSSDHGK